jgi:hypothetical protein
VTAALPTRIEAQQLLRLRSLRVGRARDGVRDAQAAVTAADRVVRERERAIQSGRDRIDALERALVGSLAPRLPRWSTMAVAQREALADRLERDEFGLIDDEHALEAAQEQLQQARAELTRALAREDAVRGLVDDTHRARRLVLESRAERELEDLGPRRSAPAC